MEILEGNRLLFGKSTVMVVPMSMPKLTRRSIFPLTAAGVVAAVDGSEGATLDPNNYAGILVRLARRGDGWQALVPDFENMNGYWRPGMVMPVKWVPLQEYLDLVDQTYSMEA